MITLYDYFLLPNRIILCVDLRSFYASVSCIKQGLDPRYTKLAVVGDMNQSGSIVLAATPPLKALGIRKMARLYEIPKRPDIIIESNYAYVYEVFNFHNWFSFAVCRARRFSSI